MNRIDLNCDLGESFGAYKMGMDEEVIPLISSANVACGFHASDPLVMSNTVTLCKKHGVAVGAHPGFPDLVGFGRRNLAVSLAEAKAMVQYQIGALEAFCRAEGVPLGHVKLHGALYNMAGKDYELAKAVCEGVRAVNRDLVMLVLAGSQMKKAADALGMKAAEEVFADRAYEEDGSLVARTKPGAMITDEKLAIERVLKMILEKKVTAVNGREIPICADSVCVHGDGEKALAFVQSLRSAFEQNGVATKHFGK
ncbi:MAG: 5-oxoprolinase subunit PxpA [Lachnospiraceae bacterium]